MGKIKPYISGKRKFQERTVTFWGAVSPIIPQNKSFSCSPAKVQGLGWNSQHIQQRLQKDKGLEIKLNDPQNKGNYRSTKKEFKSKPGKDQTDLPVTKILTRKEK